MRQGVEKTKKYVLKYILLIGCAAVYAAGISLFLDPLGIAPGGVTGIAILLNRYVPIPTGTLIFALNVPILLIGGWKLGRNLLLSTVWTILWISFFADVFSLSLVPASGDPLVAALLGGILLALGVGTAFQVGATTGGIDILVRLLRLKYRHLRTGTCFLLLDLTIVFISGVVLRSVETAAYAFLAVMTSSFLVDRILYGRDEERLLYVISGVPEQIAERFLLELHTGATLLAGRGAYSGRERPVIMCVVRKSLAPRAMAIVRETDENAFLIVTDAREIYGEGHKSYTHVV